MWPVDEMTIFFSGHLWYVGPLIRAIGMPNYQSGPDLGPVSNLCTAMWLHAMTLLHHIPDAERKWSCKTDGKVVDDDDDAYASWVWISLSIQGFYECLVSLGVFPVAQMMQLSAVPRAAISTPDARQWSDTFWLLEFPWRMPKATGKKIFWVIFVTSLKGFGCVFFIIGFFYVLCWLILSTQLLDLYCCGDWIFWHVAILRILNEKTRIFSCLKSQTTPNPQNRFMKVEISFVQVGVWESTNSRGYPLKCGWPKLSFGERPMPMPFIESYQNVLDFVHQLSFHPPRYWFCSK